VKFIVDNQLPVALAQYMRDRGFDCQRVIEAGLGHAPDSEICRHAELQERAIISKDEDFFYFAKQRHAKIKVIWVRLGNCRTAALLAAFERSWPRIESCLKVGGRVIEIR
jgi:predicted nuclease of predicted toxin-antitoxin system